VKAEITRYLNLQVIQIADNPELAGHPELVSGSPSITRDAEINSV
jgi:hypothetical protein